MYLLLDHSYITLRSQKKMCYSYSSLSSKIYFCVKYLKRMIGLVAGIFCTLIVAGLCSYCFNPDFNWYNSLVKPPFLAKDVWFTVFVAMSYISAILSVSRLVEYKHLFPSMIFFMLLAAFCILFVYAFFSLKRPMLALVFMTGALDMSYILLIRFLIKDYKIALEFSFLFLFNLYAYMCTLAIVMLN